MGCLIDYIRKYGADRAWLLQLLSTYDPGNGIWDPRYKKERISTVFMVNKDGIYDKIPLLNDKEMKGRNSFTFESPSTLAQNRLEKLMSKKENLLKQI